MDNEIWKPVITWKKGVKYDFTGKYEVSNYGRISRIEGTYYCGHHKKQAQVVKGGIMSTSKTKKGYLVIQLSNNGKREGFTVGRLVWTSFNGEIPDDMQVNHINEDKTDNRLENLNLMTGKENCNWGTHNQRISSKLKGRILSEETKQKLSESHMGEKNGMYGKKKPTYSQTYP